MPVQRLLLLLICLLTPAWAAPPAPTSPRAHWTAAAPPRLAVMIVVDQFRADYLSRFRDQLGPDGLRRFVEGGAYFPLGEYQMMQCMTGPGHSVILTGAWPARTGIPLNDWYDGAAGERVYCAQDPDTRLVGTKGGRHSGSSPRNLWVPTLGDSLKNAGLPSKVVSVSHKDRAAILLGGLRPDAAVWFDSRRLRWVTSRRYRPDGALPPWMQALNRDLAARKGQAYTWQEGATAGLSEDAAAGFTARWTLGTDRDAIDSPLGVDLLVDAALAAAKAHDLGQDDTPDLLAVSVSVFDYVGHEFGPNHRRLEAMTLAVDRAIARLMTALEAQVPGGRVVFGLTGDHGVGPTVAYSARNGLPASRHDEDDRAKALEAHLRATLGAPPAGTPWVRWVKKLNWYLADDPRARAEAATWLRQQPDVALAFTRDDVAAGRLPPEPWRTRILNQYVPGRSGDVIALSRPFHLPGSSPANHVTGYSYDRYVPIAFTGAGIQPGTHPTPAAVVDIAPTLAFLLGVLPPAGAEGRVLSEALAR